MTGGALIFTCPLCRAIVDYSCLCDMPPPIERYVGHGTVEEAKAHVLALTSDPASTSQEQAAPSASDQSEV